MSPYETSPNPFDTSDGGVATEEYPNELGAKEDFSSAAFQEAVEDGIGADNSKEKEKDEIVDMKKERDLILNQNSERLSSADRIQYEENQSRGFEHVATIDNQIKILEDSLPLLKAQKDYSKEDLDVYQTQKHDLEVKIAMRDRVNQFETKLWGNSPAEYMMGRQDLLSDIVSVESPNDISSFFKKWGALPGASTVDAPVVNEIAVSYFIKHIDDYTEHDAQAHAEKLIPHKRLREKILTFKAPAVQSVEESAALEIDYEETDQLERMRQASPDVWDEKRDIPASRKRIPNLQQVSQNAIETSFPARNESNARQTFSVEETEMRLKEQEEALIQAKEVIGSKLFEYAPFLMKFTKKGREGLAILKKAGLDAGSRGSTIATVEMARALKLKSIREREAVKNPEIPRFAHDLDARKQSVEQANDQDMQFPVIPASGERIRDNEDLSNKVTKRKHVKNIQKVLVPDGDFTPRQENQIDESDLDDEVVSSEINKFNVAKLIRRRKKKNQPDPIDPKIEIKSAGDSRKDWNPDADTDEYEIPNLTAEEREKIQHMRSQAAPILDAVRGTSEEFDPMATTAEMSIADLSPENKATVKAAREKKLPKKQREAKIRDRKALTRSKNKKATRKATTEKMREVTGDTALTDEQARVEVRAGGRRKKQINN